MRLMNETKFRLAVARTALLAGCLVILVMAGMTYVTEAMPLPQPVSDGQTIFQQKCASCHTVGGGKMVGPDLKGVTARQDPAWLKNFIMAPDKLIAQKDPTAVRLLQENNNVPMPNLGVSEADASAILDYLSAQGGAPAGANPAQTQPTAQPARPQTAASAAGDLTRGQALFTGAMPLQKGGPPCMSCHDAAGGGALGGGGLGPDLTQAYNKYGGDAGTTSILAGLQFPTMKPIYDNRPLAPDEQADLKVFLQASAAQQPAQPAFLLALLSIVGLIVLLIIARLVWRGPVMSVRKSLVKRA